MIERAIPGPLTWTPTCLHPISGCQGRGGRSWGAADPHTPAQNYTFVREDGRQQCPERGCFYGANPPSFPSFPITPWGSPVKASTTLFPQTPASCWARKLVQTAVRFPVHKPRYI